jgi:hypothetical protein
MVQIVIKMVITLLFNVTHPLDVSALINMEPSKLGISKTNHLFQIAAF